MSEMLDGGRPLVNLLCNRLRDRRVGVGVQILLLMLRFLNNVVVTVTLLCCK